MATYFHSPNNQRESTPRIYTRDSWSGLYPEVSPVLPPRVMTHMNYLSSATANELPPPQLEILSGSQNEFPVWGTSGNGMPFMSLLGSATSLLEGMQNFQGQSQGQGQGLTLSLSTQVPPIEYRNPNPSGFSSFTGNNNPPNPNREDGNLLNYGRMVPNSKFLKAAQQLLDEVVNIRKALKKKDPKELGKRGEGAEGESRSEVSQDLSSSSTNELLAAEKQDLQNKLLIMLEEVDGRYKQYYHQMKIVVSSFNVISGPGAANPYTSLALQTISCHFRILRNAITNQIKSVQKSLGEKDSSDNGKGVGISRLRFVDQNLKQQRVLQQMGMMQQQWRPQRGLPEGSVSILRAWLFEHFLHPYPKDSEKLMLARQAGLTRSQVSNWFINARVRLWKPMVEEMYKEEAGDAEMDSTSSPETGNRTSKVDTKCSDDIDNQELQPNTNSAEQNKNNPFLEFKHNPVPTAQMGELRPCLDDGGHFQGFQIQGFGRIGNSNSVSLTLGLQHCEGGSLPISVTNQNFTFYNTESSSLGPQMADFEMDSENRQHRYGSSHLLRDFVA